MQKNVSTQAAKARPLPMFISAIAAYIVALSASWLQPILISELLAIKGLGESSAGLVISVEMMVLSITSVFYTQLRPGTRLVSIMVLGALVALLGDVLSIFSNSLNSLLLFRILSGLGEGGLLLVASVALARFNNPVRAFAVNNVVNILTGTLLVQVAPYMAHLAMGEMTFPTLTACALVLFPMLLLMPRSECLAINVTVNNQRTTPKFYWQIPIVALACLLYSVTGTMTWPFAFVLGQRAGLDFESIRQVLSVAILLSLIGCFAATVIGTRFGKLTSFAIGLGMGTVACFAVTHPSYPGIFKLGIYLSFISMYFLFPLFFGLAAAVDEYGRGAAATNAAFFMSLALGPFIGGIIFEHFSYGLIGWLAIIGNSIAIALIACVSNSMQLKEIAVA